MKNNNYVLQSSGNKNISVLTYLTASDIQILNIKKLDTGLQFELNEKNYLKFKRLDLSNYDIKLVEVGGLKKIFGQVIFRMGLIIGFIVCSVLTMFLNNRLLQIHITGLNLVNELDVKKELSQQGISLFTQMNFDKDDLEKILSDKFNFSLVSIITKGNSLIISVKESLPDLDDLYAPITADYNMVITSITTYSGTQRIRVGDIVYKGDILVDPFVEKNGDRVYVKPCADISVKVFFSNSYRFQKIEERLVRTGKKQLINEKVLIGKWDIINSRNDIIYNNYEIIELNNLVSQYFLPININKIYAYELMHKTIEHDFDIEKEGIISKLKASVYDSVGKHKVDDEKLTIIEMEDGYLINFSVESSVVLKYQYYD